MIFLSAFLWTIAASWALCYVVVSPLWVKLSGFPLHTFLQTERFKTEGSLAPIVHFSLFLPQVTTAILLQIFQTNISSPSINSWKNPESDSSPGWCNFTKNHLWILGSESIIRLTVTTESPFTPRILPTMADSLIYRSPLSNSYFREWHDRKGRRVAGLYWQLYLRLLPLLPLYGKLQDFGPQRSLVCKMAETARPWWWLLQNKVNNSSPSTCCAVQFLDRYSHNSFFHTYTWPDLAYTPYRLNHAWDLYTPASSQACNGACFCPLAPSTTQHAQLW